MNQRTDVYRGRASVPAGLDEPTQQLPTLTELTNPVFPAVAYAASRLADGDVPDEMVAGLAETVGEWLRTLTPDGPVSEDTTVTATPSPFALASAAAVRAEIARLGWTVERVVERAEWLRDATADGHVPGCGNVRPWRLEPGLADRLNGATALHLDDLEIVGFVLGEDAAEFAVRMIAAGSKGVSSESGLSVVPESAEERAALAFDLFRQGFETPAVADRLGVTEDEAYELWLDHVARTTGWTRAVGKRGPKVEPDGTACKPWCMSGGDSSCGGECLADGTWIAATYGAIVLTDTGAKLPRIETNASVNQRGEVGVHLSIHGPIDTDSQEDRAAWATMSPAEARKLAAAILAEADRAEGVTR